jgi:hypothetical protein
MALMTQLKDAIAVLAGRKKAEDNTIGLQRPVTKEMQSFDDIAVKNDRISKIKDCREMDEVEPLIEFCHRLIADEATVNGFRINITSSLNTRIKDDSTQFIAGVQAKCQIQNNIWGWVYDMVMDGDLITEFDIDDNAKEITRIKKLEPLITFSNVDNYGKIDNSKPAYKQTDPYIYEKIIAEFWDYQIGHTGWKKRDGRIYGTPMFATARKAWRRLDQAEISVVGMRRLDAGDTVHWSGFSTLKEIIDFKETNKDSLANPMKPVNYYYTAGNVQMNKLSGSRNLGNLTDLEYFEDKVVMASGIPMGLLPGHEKDINRDVFEDQLKKFYTTIQKIDEHLESLLRDAFDTCLLLKGIVPESLVYTFNWGAKDRDDIDIKIKRALNLQLLGYPFEIIVMICDLDGVEYEDVIEKIKTQMADGIVPYGLGARMDPNLLALLTGMAGKSQKQESLAEDIRKLRELSEMAMLPSGDMAEFKKGYGHAIQ